MFRHQSRLIAVDDGFQGQQMILIERFVAAQGQADAMDGQGIMLGQCLQPAMRRTARPHIVFRMDFQKAQGGEGLQNLCVVTGFKANPGARSDHGLPPSW